MSAFTIQRLYQSLYNTTHNKILCVGRNYVAHAKELNNPLPKEPLFFDKPHSSVIRSGEVLYLPRNNEIHHEVELGLIEYISKYTTLHQGDIILTGTPSGVGAVSPGDFVEATLTQQGDRLANIYMKIEKGY